jgi:erythromycin esterase-like protein
MMNEEIKLISYHDEIINSIKNNSHKLANSADLEPLMYEIGDSRYVLLGEASHGTHEYYTWRMAITKRLINEKNITMIAVEGDWPDCYRLNRYVKGYADSGNSAVEVLKSFNRWPTWMWANWEMVAFAEWLKKHNSKLPNNKKVGFYGLDVYSLWESMEEITKYLEKTDPIALKSVINAVNCFEPYNLREGFSYADNTYGISKTCREDVVKMLTTIREGMTHYNTDHEAVFSLEQNALVAVNAERYYHAMMGGGESTWNIRDHHMVETLDRLMKFYGEKSKVVVWEHNTHIGDARATDMSKGGMVNVGQLVKEEHEKEGVIRVGFGSYEGEVLAAYDWAGETRKMTVPKAKKGSWEHLLHEIGGNDKLIFSKDYENLKATFGHRAIGVVYDPEYESGNYVPSVLPYRYEAFIYLDKTSSLHSLHIKPDGLQMPETYPWGV